MYENIHSFFSNKRNVNKRFFFFWQKCTFILVKTDKTQCWQGCEKMGILKYGVGALLSQPFERTEVYTIQMNILNVNTTLSAVLEFVQRGNCKTLLRYIYIYIYIDFS